MVENVSYIAEKWDWQAQIPQGQNAQYDGVTVFEGHYEYNGVKLCQVGEEACLKDLCPESY
ncbi:hypothetical protein HMSSN036_65600 [Paenibacillus macerans]|nr:hypothetical protein HMSSN036_65600 [Paenibacillus macerans]